MLRKGGHNVRVLEKLPASGTPAAGLRVPPNMSKILKRWVDEEELGKNSVLNLSSPWRDSKCILVHVCDETVFIGSGIVLTGQHMGDAAWRRAVMSETGGDFLLMAVRFFLLLCISCHLTRQLRSTKTCIVSCINWLWMQEQK